jgi:hypothetical protein
VWGESGEQGAGHQRAVALAEIQREEARLVVQASLGKKQDPISISKITISPRARRMAQVVEHLPSKCETLISNPSSNLGSC